MSNTKQQYINPNGSRLPDTDNMRVPALDRQLKDPPPDLQGLNRVLQPVPHILTELSNKQEHLIRDLATKVNSQEKTIEYLEAANTQLQKQITENSRSFQEKMAEMSAVMEQRMDAQDKKIAALGTENAQLQGRIDGTALNLTPRSNGTENRYSTSQHKSHDMMNVFNENDNDQYDQQGDEGLGNSFDENLNFDFDNYGSGDGQGEAIAFDEHGINDFDHYRSRDDQKEASAFDEDGINDFDVSENQKLTDTFDELKQCGNQERPWSSPASPQRHDPAPASTREELEPHDSELSVSPHDSPKQRSSRQPTSSLEEFSRADSEGSGFTLNTPIKMERQEPKNTLDGANQKLMEWEG